MTDRGEMRVGAVEMKCYDVCSVAPAPDSDLIVAEVVVIWYDTMIATLKVAGKEDWPIAHGAFALGGVFKTIPVGCHVTVLLDSDDMATGFHYVRESLSGGRSTREGWSKVYSKWSIIELPRMLRFRGRDRFQTGQISGKSAGVAVSQDQVAPPPL
jgi:hypothetical protein